MEGREGARNNSVLIFVVDSLISSGYTVYF